MVELVVSTESWPIRGSFTISRGAKTQADVVLVELGGGEFKGRGECVPYARYGESCDSVIEQIESLRQDVQQGLGRFQLQQRLPAGAARNALDCAFWDLQAKMSQRGVWELLDMPAMQPLTTAYTLSQDSPENMHKAALAHADRPLLKLKLAGEGDIERVRAVRKGAPKARLIVDANEGWDPGIYRRMVPEFLELGVEMIDVLIDIGVVDIGVAWIGVTAAVVASIVSCVRTDVRPAVGARISRAAIGAAVVVA